MLSYDAYKPWQGVDNWRCSLPTISVLRIYNLMRGGVEDVRQLAMYGGVPYGRLRRVDLNRLFLSADDSWIHYARIVPHLELPPFLQVQCRRCRTRLRIVPCPACPPDFILGV